MTSHMQVRRVALYARVSTVDKNQNPETQLQELRELAEARGWEVVREYVDHAPAGDRRNRVQWSQLLDDAARRRFDAILVWALDRAFRSTLDGALILESLESYRVAFVSRQEPFIDTTTPIGKFIFSITVAWAELERGIISERVQAGMRRAQREGRQIGRPTVTVDLELIHRMRSEKRSWNEIMQAHPAVNVKGKRQKPSRTTIRRAWEKFQVTMMEEIMDDQEVDPSLGAKEVANASV